MSWGKLAPTITTQFYNIGTGRFGHPEQDRALSLREGALLQTFPQDYQFYDPQKPLPLGVTARHIGNAVPVRLGYIIGKSIVEHLSRVYDSNNTSIR
jgi:DNA (cytosine-5)-methyltransferase 1